jgi:hypothetical protein
VRGFAEWLEDYAADRGSWPTLSAFLPELARRLKVEAAHPASFDSGEGIPAFDLRNAGFEATHRTSVFDAWELLSGGSIPMEGPREMGRVARDTEVKHGGGASLRLANDARTTDLIAVEQGPMAARPGATMRVSGWVKTKDVAREGAQQKVCGLYVVFLDKDGKILSRGETDSAVGTVDWTRLSGEFTVPSGTIRSYVGVLNGMSGTAWFDDVSYGEKE